MLQPAGQAAAPKLSPILRSAFETLEHGLWHFFRSDTSTDMKFAILHIDQAIELLLKEKVRMGGKSIYKKQNPKETITIWECYKILEDELHCQIPEKADLELIHEERNTIQHKYGNPDPRDTAFNVDKAVRFVSRFTKDEIGVDVADHISSEYLEQFLPKPP